MVTVVLAHSPLTGPQAWGALPEHLRRAGVDVVVLDVTEDDAPPYAVRYVAAAATQLGAADPAGPLLLVGHSGAGYLLPQIGVAQRAARREVRGYVFLDAGLPVPRPVSRLDLLAEEDPDTATELYRLLTAGGRYPTWTADDLRETVPDDSRRITLVAGLRPRGADFFTEVLPYPSGEWPDAPCGLLQTSPAYDAAARSARARGWPVVERGGGHFAALVDPDGVALDLLRLVEQL